jgi:hypothetical protein
MVVLHQLLAWEDKRNHLNHEILSISFFYSKLSLYLINITWAGEKLCEKSIVYTLCNESIEFYSCFYQQIVGLIDDSIFILIKFEVKLPCTNWKRHASILVWNRKSYLYHFCFFHISFNEKIFAFLFWEITLFYIISVGDDTWKLCILDIWCCTIAMTLNCYDSFRSFFISSWKLPAQTSWIWV